MLITLCVEEEILVDLKYWAEKLMAFQACILKDRKEI
jgi:hypothetical protein